MHNDGCNDYKVEKDRVYVKLFLLDGSVKGGFVYISLQAATHDGPEMVIDVLSQDEQFFPVDLQEGSTQLINKKQVVMLGFPIDERKTSPLFLQDVSIHQVTVHLMNHGQLDGRFVCLLPTHARRVKDYLNQAESFVELRKDGHVYLINKEHLLLVEEKQ